MSLEASVAWAGRLEASAVDVWIVDVRTPRFGAASDSGLTTEPERARATAMSDSRFGRAFLARRATLRLILAPYVEGAEPAELRLVTAPGGKPVLAAGPAFSVAHSGDLFAVAVTGAVSVGVDVERVRPVPRAGAIAARWFDQGEASRIEAAPAETRDDVFLRIWTGKEALAKRHGAGLRLMMRRGENAAAELDVADALATGHLRYLEAGAGYVAAVASASPIEAVRVRAVGEELWER